jgi:hypothetical protein
MGVESLNTPISSLNHQGASILSTFAESNKVDRPFRLNPQFFLAERGDSNSTRIGNLSSVGVIKQTALCSRLAHGDLSMPPEAFERLDPNDRWPQRPCLESWIMLTTTLLLATLAVGIDTGYEPTAEGGLEYIIQIPPHVLETLKPGEAITSEIPADLQGVQRYRIQVGTDRLPRILAPDAIQTAAEIPIQSPTAVPHQASLQSQDRKSAFEFGPNTNSSAITAPAANYPEERYGSRAPAATQPVAAPLANVPNVAQSQFPVANTNLPLQLPPPPDGLDHLYNPQVVANPNQNYPNQGVPNNQYVNANPYPNNQFPNNQYQGNQFPNNQYQGNQFPNNPQYPGGGYTNNQFPNSNYPNNMPNGAFPNGGGPNPGMPAGGFPNGGFVNNSLPGNPQVPAGQQATEATRPVGNLASRAPAIRAEDTSRVTYREEGSPGDVSAKDRSQGAEEGPKPWLPMYVTGLAAVGSLLGNLYLAWMWLETRRRYRQSIIEHTLAI